MPAVFGSEGARSVVGWGQIMRTPSKRKPRLAPSPMPHECVVLAVDTALTSGWCIMLDGAYHSSGELAAVCIALFGVQCVEVGKMVAAKSKVRACLVR